MTNNCYPTICSDYHLFLVRINHLLGFYGTRTIIVSRFPRFTEVSDKREDELWFFVLNFDAIIIIRLGTWVDIYITMDKNRFQFIRWLYRYFVQNGCVKYNMHLYIYLLFICCIILHIQYSNIHILTIVFAISLYWGIRKTTSLKYNLCSISNVQTSGRHCVNEFFY